MPEILCTHCGEVAPDNAGRCARCGSAQVLAADTPLARKFIAERKARQGGAGSGSASARTQATGKVLGRALGKFLKK